MKTNDIPDDGPDASVQPPKSSGSGPANAEDCLNNLVPPYALLFFDHLYSEYLTLKAGIADQGVIALLEDIQRRRAKCHLSWSDIYTFDLALVDVRPLENLIRKAYDARARYRSIAGQKEYDEYLASKPPDLTTILIAPKEQDTARADMGSAELSQSPTKNAAAVEGVESSGQQGEGSRSVMLVQRVLRADIKYLLSKFYLYYAMLPMRESLREQLTARAVRLTLIVLAIIVGLIVFSFGGILVFEKFFNRYSDLSGVFSLTLGSVAFAGIVGGCVSMLQRIQSAPTEGDALFNLASLTNGWRGLSLSPLYGGIFASLLFVLFAAGVLEGSVFPKINTPGKNLPVAPTVKASSKAATSPGTSSESAVDSTKSQNAVGDAAQSSSPTPTPVSETEKTGILQIKDFLKATGPTDGVSYALLIIWSFIAGFAERLVPDTLNRLVAKNEAIQGTNT
jgi:hypothetical protein